MIPKIIHYCWFGDSKVPTLTKKCISSWRKCCPEYKIIEWNESNIKLDNWYLSFCYQNRKWAFLSDLVRLLVIYQYGGIYLDTDVELLKPLDSLLSFDAFYAFETNQYIATGLGFGAVKNNFSVLGMIKEYEKISIKYKGEKIPLVPCPHLNTSALVKIGFADNGQLQKKNNILLLPVEYFNPLNNDTGKINITQNTYSIHWYGKSWLPWYIRMRSCITRRFHRYLGRDCLKFLR